MTTTADKTLADVLDDANLNNVDRAMAQNKLGTMLTPQKRAVSQVSAATMTLDPPAMGPATITARVTAGAAAAGPRAFTDEGGTPSATLATLSADGTTITFEAAVTDAVVDYLPRSEADITADFATTGLD